MRVLAIETSTLLGGAAVMDDSSGLITELRLNVKATHSERLMTAVDYMLGQAGLTIEDMDAFAVTIGPGSFTGLRIGLSTVKGFSYATGKPVVAVSTLEAFAWNFPFSMHPVCPMLDARKMEVYSALFSWEGDRFKKLTDEVSVKVSHFLEKILAESASAHEKIIFTGEGALLHKSEIARIMGGRAVYASPDKMVPSPANVASLGIKKALSGDFSEPVSLVPVYIRRSEAEMKWNG